MGAQNVVIQKNITEIKTLKKLKEIFPNIEYQKTFPFLKRYKHSVLRIDYYLPDYKIGIEYQGRQHFIPVDIFGGEEEYKKTVERDLFKYEQCEKNGITILYLSFAMPKNFIFPYKVFTQLNELIEYIKNNQFTSKKMN